MRAQSLRRACPSLPTAHHNPLSNDLHQAPALQILVARQQSKEARRLIYSTMPQQVG